MISNVMEATLVGKYRTQRWFGGNRSGRGRVHNETAFSLQHLKSLVYLSQAVGTVSLYFNLLQKYGTVRAKVAPKS